MKKYIINEIYGNEDINEIYINIVNEYIYSRDLYEL